MLADHTLSTKDSMTFHSYHELASSSRCFPANKAASSFSTECYRTPSIPIPEFSPPCLPKFHTIVLSTTASSPMITVDDGSPFPNDLLLPNLSEHDDDNNVATGWMEGSACRLYPRFSSLPNEFETSVPTDATSYPQIIQDSPVSRRNFYNEAQSNGPSTTKISNSSPYVFCNSARRRQSWGAFAA